MRISELARRGDLPVGTVKFYLREGLLPSGDPTSATQAQYGEPHVARLRLIRALLGVGGLSISQARTVLTVADDPASSVHATLGAAHSALPVVLDDDEPDLASAQQHLERWDWRVQDSSPALRLLAQAIDALQIVGFDVSNSLLDRYARAAKDLAEADVAEVPTDSVSEAVRHVVIGTLLLEPVLLALRRLAQEDASRRRFTPDEDAPPTGPGRPSSC